MANAVIGALRVNLGLDSAQFHRGLKKGNAGMAAFARRAKIAAAAAAVAFGVAAVAMAKSGLRFVDSQAKMARSMDGTIDALRALQIAASDAGVDSGQLNGAMQKLGRGLAEAARKGGIAADALEFMGLKADELLTLDADERFAVMADRAKEMGLSAQEAASLLGDLGIRSKEMALLLIQGGDAIRAARQEVDDLGLSISAVDASKVEEANDAFSRIKFATEALANRLAIALAPALKAVADAFVAAMREGGALRNLIDGIGNNIGRVAATAAAFAAFMAGRFAIAVGVAAVAAVTRLSVSLAGLRLAIMRTGFGVIIIAAGEVVLWMSRVVKSAGGVGAAFGKLKAVAAEVFSRIGDGVRGVEAMLKSMALSVKGAFLSAFGAIINGFASLTQTIADGLNMLFGTDLSGVGQGAADSINLAIAGAEVDAQHMANRAGAFFNNMTAPLESVADLMSTVADETEGAADATDEAADSADRLAEGLENVGGGAKKATEEIPKLDQALTALSERMTEIKDSFRSAFVGLVTGAKNLGETLRDLLGRFAEMAANRAFEMLWSGGFGAKKSGGGFIGKLIGGLFGGGFANGTPFAPGGLARINERGGEIINLPRGSQVIPHEMSKQMIQGGGGAVEVIGGQSDPDRRRQDRGAGADRRAGVSGRGGAGRAAIIRQHG